MIETGLKKIRSLFIFDLISYHEDNNLEKLSESLLQCVSTNVLSFFGILFIPVAHFWDGIKKEASCLIVSFYLRDKREEINRVAGLQK